MAKLISKQNHILCNLMEMNLYAFEQNQSISPG